MSGGEIGRNLPCRGRFDKLQTMDRKRLKKNIQHVVEQVVSLVHPQRVILFGSAAAGHVYNDSDLDFLIVVPEDQLPDELADRLNTQVRNRPMPCDFMVVTQSILDRNRNNPGLVYEEILTQGQEVYAV